MKIFFFSFFFTSSFFSFPSWYEKDSDTQIAQKKSRKKYPPPHLGNKKKQQKTGVYGLLKKRVFSYVRDCAVIIGFLLGESSPSDSAVSCSYITLDLLVADVFQLHLYASLSPTRRSEYAPNTFVFEALTFHLSSSTLFPLSSHSCHVATK